MAEVPGWLKGILVVAFGAATVGCASDRPVEGPVRLGQIAYVNGPRVRPDRVVEDSRCPVEANCVWAGRVIVQATVFGGGWVRTIDLELGKAVPVADGTLELVSATPLRRSGEGSRRPAYRFTFEFRGGL
ncbi:hypothetical protein [Sphingomonas sp. 1P08PE]|uniref:hypothetical protein n=1 Tax=Sphingomonas sp. 1P08PE TaxID=554122 RepID=UPI00399F6437